MFILTWSDKMTFCELVLTRIECCKYIMRYVKLKEFIIRLLRSMAKAL